MKRTLDEHAARFDAKAAEYDDSKGPEYRACRDRVGALAAPAATDVILDIGTGTGAIALALAETADRVVGRDISEGMLERARAKATAAGHDHVTFDVGRFLEPNYAGPADVITSNFALHHLDDEDKRRAIATLVERYEPDRFVLGDVMLFSGPDPEEPFHDPEVDDPATVAYLVEAMTDAGMAVTSLERFHEQVGVIAAERPR